MSLGIGAECGLGHGRMYAVNGIFLTMVRAQDSRAHMSDVDHIHEITHTNLIWTGLEITQWFKVAQGLLYAWATMRGGRENGLRNGPEQTRIFGCIRFTYGSERCAR